MTETAQTTSLSSSPIPADDPNQNRRSPIPTALASGMSPSLAALTRFLVSGADTVGRYCLIDMLVPDGAGPPAHRHDFEEMFTVLEGELEFFFRGQANGPRRVHRQHPGERPPPVQEHVGQDGPYALHVHAGRTRRVLHGGRHRGRKPGVPPPRPTPEVRAEKLGLLKTLLPKYRLRWRAILRADERQTIRVATAD